MNPLAEKLIDAWNSYDPEQVISLYSPEYTGLDVAQAAPHIGLEGLRSMFALYWRAFPDLHFTLKQSVAEDDLLSIFYQAQGTHRGPILNIPATGCRIDVQGAGLHRLLDGKIVHSLYIWDTAGMLRAMKLLPELTA
jgi:steroid delta-isomerase-like uncharacterized protein